MSDDQPRRRRDDSLWISILIAIGLVAIGAFYAPAFRGHPDAPQSSMLETARAIYLGMFSYANDHNGNYPTGKNSTEVFQKLIDEDYVSEPDIFYFPMPGKTKPTSKKLKPDNVCWDVTITIRNDDDDQVPIVFVTGYRMIYVPGGSAIPLKRGNDIQGIAVSYKSGEAHFVPDDGLSDEIVLNAISPAFNPKGKTYQQLTPDGPLKP